MRENGEKRIKMMMIIRGKREMTSKSKSKFHGEELFGPQASLRVTPSPPAPNHTRGEVIRPPNQIKYILSIKYIFLRIGRTPTKKR